jgi:hypothetical protein
MFILIRRPGKICPGAPMDETGELPTCLFRFTELATWQHVSLRNNYTWMFIIFYRRPGNTPTLVYFDWLTCQHMTIVPPV